MANISTEITTIASATRGEDVRDAFIGACQKINAESLPDVTTADEGKILAVSDVGVWAAIDLQDLLATEGE